MTFKTNLSTDMDKVFLNSDEFAEDVIYTPSGGNPRTIKAIIVRNRLEAGGEDTGRTLRRQYEVFIANDATTGVTTVNKRGDTLQFPELIGGSDITWAVEDIIDVDDGMWRLLVGR